MAPNDGPMVGCIAPDAETTGPGGGRSLKLLIAVSDLRTDSQLIASARGLAEAAGWEVLVAHVQEAESDAEARLPQDADLIVLTGEASGELVRLLAQVDVDCVAIGLRTVDAPGLGHVAQALLAEFSLPLFLVRPGMRPLTGLRRLLVPLEGTPSTSAAMRFADETLGVHAGEIVVLNVATGKVDVEAGSMSAPCYIDQEQYEWTNWQKEFIRRFCPCPESCRHLVRVRSGEPAKIIAKEARSREVELVVLSWEGSFAEGHGGVVRTLLETAPCPLLIVPAGGLDGPLSPARPSAF